MYLGPDSPSKRTFKVMRWKHAIKNSTPGSRTSPLKLLLVEMLLIINPEPTSLILTLGVNSISGLFIFWDLAAREFSRPAFETCNQNTIITFHCCYASKQARQGVPIMMESLLLALINRARGLYGRILTEVVSTDRTQWGLYTRPRSRFSHTDRLRSVNKMFIIWKKQEQFNSLNSTGLY